MLPENRIPTHPGIILREQYLDEMGLTSAAFAEHLRIPPADVEELLLGLRAVTPETAWLLSQALDTSPEFWLNLQAQHDLAVDRPSHSVEPLLKAG